MIRYGAIILLLAASAGPALAQAAAKGPKAKDVRIEGKLSPDDPRDPRRNAPHKVHLVPLKAGTTYTIDMVSRELDSYLRLEDPRGKQLAEDDDSGGNLNAQIVFDCEKDGVYRIIATSFNPNGAGRYVLTVKGKLLAQQVTALARLLGKTAPDFQADFALNGTIHKLSELRGKVVLVEFWDARSGACAATFARLRDWSKAYKQAGLAIVGVTFYPSEIGQHVGFDKETGKIKDLPRSDKATEQAMLRDFARYHKLDYPLLALPRAEALRAFNDYLVNGVPELVLIDRRGIVRLVRTGESAERLAAVEKEIQKVLAEK
jgi:peroxiredoxin